MEKVTQLYLFKEVESHMRITDKIYVRAYRKQDGSYVRKYWRKRPTRRNESRKLTPTEVKQLSLIKKGSKN